MKAKQIISEMAKRPLVRKPQAVQPQGLGPIMTIPNVHFNGEVTKTSNETQARRAMLATIDAEKREILGDDADKVKVTLTYMDYDYDRHDETYAHMFQINLKGPALLLKKLAAAPADFVGDLRPEDIEYEAEIEQEDKRFPFKTKHGKVAMSPHRQKPHFNELRAAYDELYANHRTAINSMKWRDYEIGIRKLIRKTIAPLVGITDIAQWGDFEDDLTDAVCRSDDFVAKHATAEEEQAGLQ